MRDGTFKDLPEKKKKHTHRNKGEEKCQQMQKLDLDLFQLNQLYNRALENVSKVGQI